MGNLTKLSREIISRKSEEPEWYEGLLERIGSGENVLQVARDQGVTHGSMLKWIRADEERLAAFHEAQRIAAQRLVDESLEIADTMEQEDAFKAKLRIDTRLRIAGKLDMRFGNGPAVSVEGTNIQVVMTDFTRREVSE